MRSQPRTSDRYNSKRNRDASSYTNTIKSETIYGNISSQAQTNGPETKDNGETYYGPVFLNPQDGCMTHVSSYDLWLTAADGREYCLDICGNTIYKDGIYSGAERTINTSQTALSNTIFAPSSSTQSSSNTGSGTGTDSGTSSTDLTPLWDQVTENTQAIVGNATIANEAKAASTTAVTTANEAKATADTAQATANTAESKADAAQTTANTAVTKADAAQTTANTAESKADAAQTTADTAVSKAQTAQTTADTAESKADAAQTTANTAVTKADTAQTTADTAVSKAAAAHTAADNAQTTANTAGSTAEIAQTAASEAKTESAAAKSTADAAQTTANTAVTKADAAQTTANTAESKADAAQSTANNANSLSTKNAEEILRIEIGGASFVNLRWTMQTTTLDIRKIAGSLYVDGDLLSMQNNNITPFELYPPFYDASGSEITTVTCRRGDLNGNNTQATVNLSECHLQFGIIYGNTYVVTIVTPTDTSSTYSFPDSSLQEIQVKRESLVNIYSDIHELANEVGALKTTVDGISTSTATPGVDGNVVVNSGYAVEYATGYNAPTTTTNKLYPKDNVMYYNGSPIFNTSIVMDLSASIDDIVGELTTMDSDIGGTGKMSLQAYDVYRFTMQPVTTGAIAGNYTTNGVSQPTNTTLTILPPFCNSSGSVITTMQGGIKLSGGDTTIDLTKPISISPSGNGDTSHIEAKDTNGDDVTFAKDSSFTLINRGPEVVYSYNKNVTSVVPSVQASRNLIVANSPFTLLRSPSTRQQQSLVSENETLRSRVDSLEATVATLQRALVSSGVIKK